MINRYSKIVKKKFPPDSLDSFTICSNYLFHNGSIQLKPYFLDGAKTSGAITDEIKADEINLDYCTGCLRCNLIKRCSIRGDE